MKCPFCESECIEIKCGHEHYYCPECEIDYTTPEQLDRNANEIQS